MASLLYASSIRINDAVSVLIPTVGEIMDNEDAYYDAVCTIIATPYDMMVQLDDAGIDFTEINDFDLFCMLFPRLQQMDLSMILGELTLRTFVPVKNRDTGEIVLRDPDTGYVIDRAIHTMIANSLRKILNLKKENKKPGNDDAKRYLIERARIKMKRRKKRASQAAPSQLEGYITSLVNTPEFKYDYSSVRDITIYQFYESLRQIVHKIHYDNTMIGYYAGTVKLDDLPQESRTWMLTNN